MLHTIIEYSLRFENLLHCPVKNFGDLERQWQAGVVLFGFDGIDRLARDAELVGQVRLGPVELGPQIAHDVLHWYLRDAMLRPIPQSMISSGVTQITSA